MVHLEPRGQLVQQGLGEQLAHLEELEELVFLDHQVQLDFRALPDQLELLELLVAWGL